MHANSASLSCETIARSVIAEPPRKSGAELLFRCPRHDDRHPSLSINPAKNVWMCGPCGKGGTAWQLAAFLVGVDAGDKEAISAWLIERGLLPKHERKGKAKSGRGPCVATYPYTDAQGNPFARKLRHEPGANGKPKDYLWERLQNGKWVPGLGDPPLIPPLYKLPQIKDAPRVFVFESNPDVDLACSMGLAATTSGGCNSWRPEYAELLRGKDVCVVPDNGGPGARYAAIVCASLYGKVNSLKVVSVAPEKDFTCWIRAGGNADKLFDLWEAAPEWKPATGAEILDATMGFIRRFVSLSEAQARAVVLWVAHTHAFDAADCTPYLAVNSPEKQSGKTRLLEVLRLLVFCEWFTGRVTAAVLTRKIDAKHPTLLLDESDAAFAGEKEYAEALRGILNTGYRRGGAASCCVGKGAEMDYRDFSTFCAKAIAGIGKLPDTVADRSIPIRLKRARRSEVARFREREAQREGSEIAARLAEWSASNLETLRQARPEIPAQLSDRQADTSEPLLAIADLAGGDWPKGARTALIELCGGAQGDDDSIGVKLLSDVRRIFYPHDDDGNQLPALERIASADVAKSLGEMEDRPWPEWGKSQKPITQPQLARLLARYEIGPRNIRFPDGRVLRGYERYQFTEPWGLYLPPDGSPSLSTPSSECYTATTPMDTDENGDFQSATAESCSTPQNAISSNKDAACSTVAFHPPPTGRRNDLGIETDRIHFADEVEL